MCTRDITFIVLPKKRFLKPEDKFTIFGLPLQIKSTSLVNCVPFLRSINNLPSPPAPSKKKALLNFSNNGSHQLFQSVEMRLNSSRLPGIILYWPFPFCFFPRCFALMWQRSTPVFSRFSLTRFALCGLSLFGPNRPASVSHRMYKKTWWKKDLPWTSLNQTAHKSHQAEDSGVAA